MNKRLIYFILFAVSGFSGLIYESVWSHYLKLFLGHAAYAQTLVLMIYMGGMAIGAYAVSKLGPGLKNPLFWYAVCEAGIGVLAFVFHPVFTGLVKVSYQTIIPHVSFESGLHIYKWLLSAILIVPQSVLLGATFPLMSGGVLRKFPCKPGESLAGLYFTNSFGGAIGVLMSGYFLIGIAGYPGTIAIAGALNIAIAFGVWILIGRKGELQQYAVPQNSLSNTIGPQKPIRAFLLVSALTGASSFMYEIGWIRMLGLVLGSYTHAFELMLSAFIFGLAVGSFFIRFKIDTISNTPFVLSIVQLLMGLFSLVTIVFYNNTFDMMQALLGAVGNAPHRFLVLQLSSQAVAYFVMLPATICAGMTLPLITFHLLENNAGEKSIGSVYAANTIGAILGILIAVQFILPVFGLKNLIIIGAGIDIALGLFLLRQREKAFFVLAVCSLAAIAFCVFGIKLDTAKMANQVFTEGPWDTMNKVIFHKDGKTATVDVVHYAKDNTNGICTNGMNVGTLGVVPNVISQNATLLATIPMAMTIAPKSIATFGVGTGYNARVFLSDTSIRSVDIIEIEKRMYEGSLFLGGWVQGVYNDKRVHPYVEDARSFFAWKNKQYDIVVADISYVWVSGVAGLFSKEFYAMMRSHILQNGVFVQWMHSTSMPLLASIITALSESFSDYAIYYSGQFMIIVAGNDVSLEKINDSVFSRPGPSYFLHENSIDAISDFRFHYLGGRKSLDPLFHSYDIAPNSDYFPVLDQRAFESAITGKNDCFEKLYSLRFMRLPIINMLENRRIYGKSLYAKGSQSGARATAIHDFCIAKDGRLQAANSADGNLLFVLQQPIGLDSNTIVDNAVRWITALNGIMSICLPVLSCDEIADIIAFAGANAGPGSQIPDVRRSLELYTAINGRDYATCYSIASYYLAQTSDIAEHESFFLPLAMLCAIYERKNDVVMELWQRYSKKSDPQIAVRLLYEIAKSGIVRN